MVINNFCTLSDRKYLLQGLALYDSLTRMKESFKLHYLCLDDETYNVLLSLNLDKIRLIKLSDLEKEDKDLINFESNPDSVWGDRYTQYCWAMAPYLCDLLINKEKLSEILYCDSDIYFFNDFHLIEEEIGNKSIGIVKHRITPKECEKPGIYNVGIIFFKGDISGRSCCNFWKGLLFNPNNRYSKKFGTCGDQKYLELFPMIYNSVLCIIDKKVGHLAPWNWKYYGYPSDNEILYRELNIVQKLVYYHFARFKVTDDFKGFTCNYNGGNWINIVDKRLKRYHVDYFNKQVELKNRYNL